MTFKSQDDAIAWVSARRAEIEMEVWAPDAAARGAMQRSAPNFGAYAKVWLEGRKTKGRELRPTTRYHYQQLLDIYINPTFGEMRIDRITVDDVNKWYDELAPGKETARAQAYSLLRTILTTAASTQPKPLIPFNPAHIRGAGNTQRVHKVRPASLQELETIVAELPERYRLMALLAAWCAMRFGELAELRRGDIDLRDKRVKIRRGVVRVDGQYIVGPPKTDAGIRDVAIPPHLLPAVEAHLEKFTGPDRDSLLFPSAGKSASHMAPATLYKVFYPAREAAGRKDLRWHDLRHTGAVLAAQTGATLAELMGRLGHTTPGAAMRYQHAAADRDTEIAKRLSELAERRPDE
ncbi:MAG TPA: site-specific integrase [Nocardioides sp.]|uniref:tyrosine-type recombinase/integrase n=1 Tax=uncultured Nocardioides sp. TaxID=198441 RepID=UPI002632D3E9|nr:site-specific integrase [uncultured Nocardioides sp.]HRD59318.1 site-specific integrase [Nocardioides sp.]HRI95449.1 site-specific integrase [Nocardioides sp.]HRK44669.1 site-specific integrase [Nocardioides sp.]